MCRQHLFGRPIQQWLYETVCMFQQRRIHQSLKEYSWSILVGHARIVNSWFWFFLWAEYFLPRTHWWQRQLNSSFHMLARMTKPTPFRHDTQWRFSAFHMKIRVASIAYNQMTTVTTHRAESVIPFFLHALIITTWYFPFIIIDQAVRSLAFQLFCNKRKIFLVLMVVKKRPI